MSFSCRQWQAGPVAAAGALMVALTVGPAQAQDKTITMKITTPTLNAALDIYAKAYAAAVEKDSGGRHRTRLPLPARKAHFVLPVGSLAGCLASFAAIAKVDITNWSRHGRFRPRTGLGGLPFHAISSLLTCSGGWGTLRW